MVTTKLNEVTEHSPTFNQAGNFSELKINALIPALVSITHCGFLPPTPTFP